MANRTIGRVLASVFLLLIVSSFLAAKVFDKTAEVAGMPVHYKVALPRDYDPEKTYPAVLAFPPGAQTMDMVLTTMMQNWWMEGDRRGYIVVVPAAPQGQLFTGQGDKIFPEFIELLLREYKVRNKKFHIAGMSNGGRSAFHIAASYPQYFQSVIGFPGYLPEPTPERVAALSKMCIYMHVGEFDTGWVQQMQQQASMFRSKGYSVQLTIEKGEGHVMRTLTGEGSTRLFKEIEESRNGCGAVSK
jgi:predicted peptidase